MRKVIFAAITAGSLAGCAVPSATPPYVYSAPMQSNQVDGTWKGTYVCSQGVTNLTLSLQTGRYGDVSGVFMFSANASNPIVPSGEFRVSGQLIGNRLLLKSGNWIRQAPGYTPLDIDGVIDIEKKSYTGTLCGHSFGLQKIG